MEGQRYKKIIRHIEGVTLTVAFYHDIDSNNRFKIFTISYDYNVSRTPSLSFFLLCLSLSLSLSFSLFLSFSFTIN